MLFLCKNAVFHVEKQAPRSLARAVHCGRHARVKSLSPLSSNLFTRIATPAVFALPLLVTACDHTLDHLTPAAGGSLANGGSPAVRGQQFSRWRCGWRLGRLGGEPRRAVQAASQGSAGSGGGAALGTQVISMRVFGDAGDAAPDASAAGSFIQVAAIFAQSCAGGGGPPGPLQHNCHSSSPFDGMLDLTVSNAYSALVNHPADINPSYTRVIPGDPDHSLLMRKLLYQLP